MSEPGGLERQMVKGSAWTVSVRWAARALGFVNTLFLARLLSPSDFGIVTIAMIILGTVEIFNQTGQHLAIIRHPSPTRAHYDSAWTIFIMLSTFLAAIVFLCAPLTRIYFHEPRAVIVVEILALKTLVSGFENIGIVDFQKHLQFHKQFLYRFFPSLIAFCVTIPAAFILRNYWALVIGILAQEFSGIALSYILSPFRPHLALSKVRELWSFSIWTFFRSIGAYLENQIDKLAIGSFAGAAAMGRYEVAVDVSSSPSQEINNPMLSVLFPVLATAQGDRQKLRELFLTVLYWSMLICSSTAVGVALVSDDLVDIVLGPQWDGMKPLMPVLALAYGVMGLGGGVYPVFDVINKPFISTRLQWLSVLTIGVSLALVGYLFRNIQGVALARLATMAVLVPVMLAVVGREIQLRPRDFWTVFWRPLLATLLMAAVTWAARLQLPPGGFRLAVTIVAGAATYAASLMALWQLAGRPSGPETVLWHALGHIRRGFGATLINEMKSGSGRLHRESD